ncbi:efflux RND transporter periplasmic adaptor subunit [Oryzibacter oryziterrae]|uniref:efflux RND transporter periplasmic adaptor subunit n=1 Tax=Oryzibacter oryziterrae TaxID=2766474 RepID=UPI0028BEFF5D|nr:efflux RND transporter periplasmic adaptor subunit [Oryzibacter oryziterrae]
MTTVILAGCQEQSAPAGAGGPPPGKAMVSVITLHPRSVAVTAELPGRTTASLVAEVRPQVSGIIKDRPFKEGSEVKAGDLLYEIDAASYQATYDSALAALQKAEAGVPSAQAKVDRYNGLLKQNAVAKQDVDDAVASLAQAKADVASAKAAVEAARIDLEHTRITAPISGRIGASTYSVGALVTSQQATPLTTIRALDPIYVDVTQSSANLLKFRKDVDDGRLKIAGEHVAVKLQLETGTTYDQSGKLEFAEANVDQSTGSFTLRATFANPKRLLVPGMYVRATVEEGVAENSFLIPQRAVSRTPAGDATARFVNADGKVEDRIITTERTVGNNWLVDKGVAEGDRVIVEGGMMIRAGQDVTPQEVTIDEATGAVKAAAAAEEPAKAAASTPAAPTTQTK